jgi:sugar transferase (PEP-CTERM system associated)
MIRIFKHYVPQSLVLLGFLEVVWLFVSVEAGWRIRLSQISKTIQPISDRTVELGLFAGVVLLSMVAVGYYRAESIRSLRVSFVRLLAALFFATVALAVVFFFLPDIKTWRSVFIYAFSLVIVGITLLRAIFIRLGGLDSFKRRVLVMGAGQRAQQICLLGERTESSFTVVRAVRMAASEQSVASAMDRESIASLIKLTDELNIDEVVLAVDERRGGLPVASLIEVKLAGTPISELTTFIERETGRVDVDVLNPSWIIFGDGFRASHQMAIFFKRIFDLSISAILLILAGPVLLLTAAIIKLTSPGPIFYRQERVGLNGNTFAVLKFRSMRQDAEKAGAPQWAQKSDPRVTPIGKFIRATRIDEIPQIFNVFKGDMSFVGPRPERPFFVNQLSQQIPFFAERHAVKPGITGWAQINYPYGASVEDARAKLEYDLYYVKNYSLMLDFLILIQTVRVVLWQDGVR